MVQTAEVVNLLLLMRTLYAGSKASQDGFNELRYLALRTLNQTLFGQLLLLCVGAIAPACCHFK